MISESATARKIMSARKIDTYCGREKQWMR